MSTRVLLYGDRRPPRPLSGLPTTPVTTAADVDAAAEQARRLIVVGSDADLAAVLTRLLRTERLQVEVAPVRLGWWRGRWAARRAHTGAARRVPLIRDETGSVVVGAAEWRAAPDEPALHGEAVVDDTVLFDGDVTGVRIEPTESPPGLRAAVLSGRGRTGKWVVGRAAQLGTTGAQVIRDGVAAARPVRRSTFYRHTEGWLRVG